MTDSEFLESTFGFKDPSHYVQVWLLEDHQTRRFRDVSKAVAFVDAHSEQDAYVCVGLTDEDLGPHERGAEKDIAALAGLVVEADFARPGSNKKGKLPTREQALDAIKAMPHDPSFIAMSGHGYHAWWLFKEPWAIETEAERKQVKNLSMRWSAMFKSLAQERGFGVDSVFDLTRLMRVPGTLNVKDPDHPVRARIVEQSDWRAADLETFEAVIRDDLDVAQAAPAMQKKAAGLVLSPRAAAPAEKRNILETNSEQFRQTLAYDRSDLTDESPSGYDMSAAIQTAQVGWEPQEIANLLIEMRRRNGADLKIDRPDYYERTIAKAFEFAERNNGGGPESGPKSGGDKPMKQAVLDLALAQDIELFTDQQDAPHCRIRKGGHFETLPIGRGSKTGKQFADWLGWLLYDHDGRMCATQTLEPARRILRVKARHEGGRHELKNRVGKRDGALWYDLTDDAWRAVRITADGWEIEPEPPVLFKRYSHQLPQVDPQRVDDAPGTLEGLFEFMNVDGEQDRLLFLIYVVSLLVPDIAHPVPVIHGEHGSGKTFMLKVIRQLVDPSAVGTLSIPWKPAEFVQQLDHHWCGYYDNLTSLTDWQQDIICRAVTGEGNTKRELYSDDDDVIYNYKRCIALNGITLTSTRPDLMDRSVLFELNTLEGKRGGEAELLAALDKARPRLLGALLNVVSGALRADEGTAIELGRFFRLADWAAWGWRIGEALGGRGDEFIDAYARATETKARTALDLHPLGAAVVAFMQDREAWEGSPKELFMKLHTAAAHEGIEVEDNRFPGNVSWLGRRLKEVRPDLRTAGIDYVYNRDAEARSYKLTRGS